MESSLVKTTADHEENKDPPHIFPKTGTNDSGENILCTDKVNVERSGNCASCYIIKQMDHFKNISPEVKHGGGRVVVWGGFAASAPAQLLQPMEA